MIFWKNFCRSLSGLKVEVQAQMSHVLDSSKGFDMPLADGELVHFRPVRPDDISLLETGMSALSAQSRLFRFFSPISRLSAEQLRYFTDVDQQQHVAWIAVSQRQSEPTGLGIARFVRSLQQPNMAEFAIVVIDSYQQRGLGVMLMSLLYKTAISKKIEVLSAAMLLENTIMSNWLARLGAVGAYDNGSYRMDLRISSEWPELLSSSLQKLRTYLQGLDDSRLNLLVELHGPVTDGV
jgi:GNAT superfamily N-acetyltransferase